MVEYDAISYMEAIIAVQGSCNWSDDFFYEVRNLLLMSSISYR